MNGEMRLEWIEVDGGSKRAEVRNWVKEHTTTTNARDQRSSDQQLSEKRITDWHLEG